MIEIDGQYFDDFVCRLRKDIITERACKAAKIIIDGCLCAVKNPNLSHFYLETAKGKAKMIFIEPIFPIKLKSGGIVLPCKLKREKS